jgi:small-conductance mechanosensitive channel
VDNFPEVIGIAIVAILAPYALIQMYTSGKILLSIIVFFVWLVSIIYTFIFIKREQYFLAGLPMAGVLAVGLIINYGTKIS